VLFLQGGARLHFAAVPMNLLGEKKAADYIYTGEWSKLAIKEANRFCEVNIAASSMTRTSLRAGTVALAARPDVGVRALRLERDHRRGGIPLGFSGHRQGALGCGRLLAFPLETARRLQVRH